MPVPNFIKAVPDTNVLMSGLLWRGPSREILNKAEAKELELYGSEGAYEEFCRVVYYPKFKKYLARNIYTPKKLILDYKGIINMVSLYEILDGVSFAKDDPDDDKFIRIAKVIGAKIIVSGDPHLLKLKKVGEIRIVEPAVFLKIFPKLRGKIVC